MTESFGALFLFKMWLLKSFETKAPVLDNHKTLFFIRYPLFHRTYSFLKLIVEKLGWVKPSINFCFVFCLQKYSVTSETSVVVGKKKNKKVKSSTPKYVKNGNIVINNNNNEDYDSPEISLTDDNIKFDFSDPDYQPGKFNEYLNHLFF